MKTSTRRSTTSAVVRKPDTTLPAPINSTKPRKPIPKVGGSSPAKRANSLLNIMAELTTLTIKARKLEEREQKSRLEFLRMVGKILILAKDVVGDGKFERWVREKCKFSKQSAEIYLGVARHWPEIEPSLAIKTNGLADLTLTHCMELLVDLELQQEVNSQPDNTPANEGNKVSGTR